MSEDRPRAVRGVGPSPGAMASEAEGPPIPWWRAWAAGIWWLVGGGVAVSWVVRAGDTDQTLPESAAMWIGIAAAAIALSTGAVIAARTGNGVGWVMTGGSIALLAGLAAAVIDPDLEGVPVIGSALWVAALQWAALVFPAGSMHGLRERGVAGRRAIGAGLSLGLGSAVSIAGAASASRPWSPTASATAVGEGLHVLAIGVVISVGAAVLVLLEVRRRLARVSGSDREELLPIAVTLPAALAILVAGLAASLVTDASAPAFVGVSMSGGAIALAVTISVIRQHAFGIYRLVGYIGDHRIWTVALGLSGVVAVAGVAVITQVLTDAEGGLVVAAVAVLASAAVLPLWRRWQRRVDVRFGQRQPDPAATLEALEGSLREEDRPGLRRPLFELLRGFASVVVVDGTDGMRFAVRTDDREIGRHTFVHGAYDLPIMRRAIDVIAASRNVPISRALEGSIVLDIGANIGTSIVPLIRLFGADGGVAVEPAPANLEMLELTLALNGLTQEVTIVPMAVSDRPGTAPLLLSVSNFGDHQLAVQGRSTVHGRSDHELEVPVTTVDALAEQGLFDPHRVGLMWIDVQGLEGHVLAGASRLLVDRVPLVTEFWPSQLRQVDGLARFVSIVERHYSIAVDLRAEAKAATRSLAATLEAVIDRHDGDDAFTDVLFLP
ncbi:MAG: FkbM family methyltransferase [Actinomycetota bacterium]